AGSVLGRRYAQRSVARRGWIPVLFLLAGTAGSTSGLLAPHQYGPVATPGAAVVAEQAILRSVRTEAESPQQQEPLAARAAVTVQQAFLGWTKVERSDGETGWLRHHELVPLYAAPTEEEPKAAG